MKLLLEYFGMIIFAFVVLVGGLILLPRVTPMPETSPGEMVGLALAFVVIGGGFSWYYLATSHQGTPNTPAGP
jgi:drug/metabolite transporter (DMT)-like permease